MIFVNFKTYQQGTGEAALFLAKICQEVEKTSGIKIIPVVQAVDIFRLASQGLTVWAQHVDEVDFGSYTGQVLSKSIFDAGAKGTLLNHSEKKLSFEKVKNILQGLKGLQSLICVESIKEGQQVAELKPDFLAYESSELIGGQVSVSQARPEIIREFVDKIRDIPVLVGAGIHKQIDVKRALELGAKGVLVSSDVVLADNPQQELLDLAGGFR
ncbi:triose-phosphate isomerase [Patescibacteria group bacterium]|nr:triose-phosphate isomerase [Patescibacteria group bacterium]